MIRDSAYADLIIVNGNPLGNITLAADAHTNFVVITKDGKVFKDEL